MDKYLLPWSELLEPFDSSDVKIFYTRKFLIDSNVNICASQVVNICASQVVNICASQVWRLSDVWAPSDVWRGSFHYEDSPTKEDAMRKEDEYLIKNGFILLTEKQAERLIVLV
jgi:hypothetical protein